MGIYCLIKSRNRLIYCFSPNPCFCAVCNIRDKERGILQALLKLQIEISSRKSETETFPLAKCVLVYSTIGEVSKEASTDNDNDKDKHKCSENEIETLFH